MNGVTTRSRSARASSSAGAADAAAWAADIRAAQLAIGAATIAIASAQAQAEKQRRMRRLLFCIVLSAVLIEANWRDALSVSHAWPEGSTQVLIASVLLLVAVAVPTLRGSRVVLILGLFTTLLFVLSAQAPTKVLPVCAANHSSCGNPLWVRGL
eukprot:6473546-Prymnesium_polylepis.1